MENKENIWKEMYQKLRDPQSYEDRWEILNNPPVKIFNPKIKDLLFERIKEKHYDSIEMYAFFYRLDKFELESFLKNDNNINLITLIKIAISLEMPIKELFA